MHMNMIGLEIIGNFDHISKATTTGIHAVDHPILAALAEVMTGAIISATTAGRIPLKIAVNVGLLVINSGVRNIAMNSIIKRLGIIVPSAATTQPRVPRNRSPIATAMLTAKMPGSD